jgi:hypothetical protein
LDDSRWGDDDLLEDDVPEHGMELELLPPAAAAEGAAE